MKKHKKYFQYAPRLTKSYEFVQKVTYINFNLIDKILKLIYVTFSNKGEIFRS